MVYGKSFAISLILNEFESNFVHVVLSHVSKQIVNCFDSFAILAFGPRYRAKRFYIEIKMHVIMNSQLLLNIL